MANRKGCAAMVLLLVVLGCFSGAAGSSLRKPLPMEDILGDNYHMRYDKDLDVLRLNEGDDPMLVKKLEKAHAVRKEVEAEKSLAFQAAKATVDREDEYKKLLAEKVVLLEKAGALVDEEVKQLKFKNAEAKEVRDALQAPDFASVKELLGKGGKLDAQVEGLNTKKKEAAEVKVDAQKAFDSNTNANQKSELKTKLSSASEEERRLASEALVIGSDLKNNNRLLSASKALCNRHIETNKETEMKKAAEIQTLEDDALTLKKRSRKAEEELKQAIRVDPNGLAGRVVLLESNSKNSKGKFFSSCPGQGKTNEWITGKVLNRGWKLEIDDDGSDIRSKVTVVHLQGLCSNKKGQKPVYLYSSSLEGAGFMWGDKDAKRGWKLEFGEEGAGEKLLVAGKSYVSMSKSKKFIQVGNVKLIGVGAPSHGKPYYMSNRPEKEGASWGEEKDASGPDWKLIVATRELQADFEAGNEPSTGDDAVKGDDGEKQVSRTVKHGGVCSSDDQCQGISVNKSGFCRSCNKCQRDFGETEPCSSKEKKSVADRVAAEAIVGAAVQKKIDDLKAALTLLQKKGK